MIQVEVKSIEYNRTKQWLLEKHYAHRMCPVLPYPKGESKRYSCVDVIETNLQ